eukprot:CAMPEP_0118812186 /NCGR_PEP_ID=MMETSP1162-20130426/2130_1 /TAXON_ID=33656 /ORGANISM="Phaeocystis Sp, Strain CCMP2710" /LENGTH=290 /DNA_ID=CAMNT_0006741887 /DNA_START=64 /DNA_END=936 /DNA_ORIENTATION=-
MPGGKHEHMKAWSSEEDHIIIDGVQLHGHQWRLIVRDLPGRSVSSTRNRWNRIEKGRMMREAGTRGRNICHLCWQPKKGHICTAKVLADCPQVAKQALVVRPAPPFIVAQQRAVPHVPGQGAAPHVPEPTESKPAPNANPPSVQKSSSMLSVLGGEDLGAIFGDWAKADAAENAGGIGPCAVTPVDPAEVSVGAAPPLPMLLSLPQEPTIAEVMADQAVANQQLEAIAPPALLRMASGEGPTRWVPPKLSRSLSSFLMRHLPQDLLQGPTVDDAPSDAGHSSDMSLADLP